ncbi:MAG: hypothetical protein KDD51_16130 [Bdellovibrionales bacterium]|nr:hypothetical protein [Bdellovibrionales bacterium]MCB0417391.1 hypothetical protein [Bdellovibrionales bacterium]MCB9254679.1 hypothetical protein [Pseudobdellovibrionaceae bacterium]
MNPKLGVLLAPVLFLAWIGCANTQIIAKADGSYMVHSTSSSESYALKGAVKDAEAHCATLGKRFAMIDQRTQYQGMDKTAKGVIGAVGALTRSDTDYYSHRNSMDSAEDYKVELDFVCK